MMETPADTRFLALGEKLPATEDLALTHDDGLLQAMIEARKPVEKRAIRMKGYVLAFALANFCAFYYLLKSKSLYATGAGILCMLIATVCYGLFYGPTKPTADISKLDRALKLREFGRKFLELNR